MKPTTLLMLVALVTSLGGGSALAQEILYSQPQVLDRGAGNQFLLTPTSMPVVSSTPLFQAAGGVGAVGTNTQSTVAGKVVTSNRFDAAIGFDYLLPLWSFRDFLIAVPAPFAGVFPVLGGTGHVDNHFSFAPIVKLNYYVTDADFSVSTSGTFVSLTGDLNRSDTSTINGTGKLESTSSLTFVSANLVEFSRRYAFLDLFPSKQNGKPSVVDSVIDLSIGTRYSSIDQNYTGTLTGGVNGSSIAQRHSTQHFRGIGLTSSANWILPCGDDFLLFSNTRGSILVGDNHREAAISVNATGLTGFADTLSETKTTFIPVLEMELGTEWGQDLGNRLRYGEEPPRFTIRVAFVSQFWGSLGPLSPASTQGFRNSDLFLIGVNVEAGLRY
jgi:hypothetical protein